MKTSNIPKNAMRNRITFLIVGIAVIGLALILFFTFLIGLNTIPNEKAAASSYQTFTPGSFIVDMGVLPQSHGNALKPYGMIWDLLTNHNTPVYWGINPFKAADGIDFSHGVSDYRGGPFVIDVNDITPAVASRITYWMSQGVVGTYTTVDIYVPVYTQLKYWPNIIVDILSGNQAIIQAYFTNAGIDSTGYTLGVPADATTCYDIWVNPHGDPTWATHSPLYDFVTYHKGFIWSQCHAVSMLEDVVEPVAPFRQLNYLTTTGLQCWKVTGAPACGPFPFDEGHAKSPTSPYTHYHPGTPVMQFMGKAQGALNSNGSEKWFIPLTGGSWRMSTKRTITTSDGTSPGEGVLMAYGPAYGNPNYGMVMYSGGHDHQGGGSLDHQIAAQRAFLNFVLLAGKERSIIQSSNITTTMTGLNWYNLSVTTAGGYPPYTIQWTSSIGGIFSHPDSTVTNYAPPNLTGPVQATITCTVTDSCSRSMAVSQLVTITPSPLPITLKEFTATPQGLNKVVVKWTTASENNNKHFTVWKSETTENFEKVTDIPSQGNSVSEKKYVFTDIHPYPGRSYYRLSQTDINGGTKLFDPVAVELSRMNHTSTVTVGPNPFVDHINISYPHTSDIQVSLGLYDIKGRRIEERVFEGNRGSTILHLNNLEHLPKGNYILKVTGDQTTSETFRLIK